MFSAERRIIWARCLTTMREEMNNSRVAERDLLRSGKAQ
jgi:hypothetical protein